MRWGRGDYQVPQPLSNRPGDMDGTLPELHWQAVYTHAGKEARVTEYLRQEDIECLYLWYTEQKRNSQGRYLPRRMSYYPRYVFARLSYGDLYKVNSRPEVCFVLDEAYIHDAVMEELSRLALASGEVLVSRKSKRKRWRPGTRLRVADKSSPLYNMELVLNSLQSNNVNAIIHHNDSFVRVNLPVTSVEPTQEEPE